MDEIPSELLFWWVEGDYINGWLGCLINLYLKMIEKGGIVPLYKGIGGIKGTLQTTWNQSACLVEQENCKKTGN